MSASPRSLLAGAGRSCSRGCTSRRRGPGPASTPVRQRARRPHPPRRGRPATPPPAPPSARACYRLTYDQADRADQRGPPGPLQRPAHRPDLSPSASLDPVVNGHLLAVDSDAPSEAAGRATAPRSSRRTSGPRASSCASAAATWSGSRPTIEQSDAGRGLVPLRRDRGRRRPESRRARSSSTASRQARGPRPSSACAAPRSPARRASAGCSAPGGPHLAGDPVRRPVREVEVPRRQAAVRRAAGDGACEDAAGRSPCRRASTTSGATSGRPRTSGRPARPTAAAGHPIPPDRPARGRALGWSPRPARPGRRPGRRHGRRSDSGGTPVAGSPPQHGCVRSCSRRNVDAASRGRRDETGTTRSRASTRPRRTRCGRSPALTTGRSTCWSQRRGETPPTLPARPRDGFELQSTPTPRPLARPACCSTA